MRSVSQTPFGISGVERVKSSLTVMYLQAFEIRRSERFLLECGIAVISEQRMPITVLISSGKMTYSLD